jgi:phosphoribosylanthranilate isomerase
MSRTRIKICGLTREADVQAAVDAGADAVGFVLWPHSPRFVPLQRAVELAADLPPFVTPVLLFVNAASDELRLAQQALPNAIFQFHGDETPGQCAASGSVYVRAARMAPDIDLLDFAHRFHGAQALLLDSFVDSFGGAGKVFDWSRIPKNVPLPLVLSGGLNPANVSDGIHRVRPCAVDVSTGVEAAKGIKDATLMRQFCQAVFEADRLLAQA